ncbi:hypothetical protein G9A89_016548 [Geosiphon pyriformis]|nr:hypothetical protein G9A89_016548 [Geosiphon pyriformis]
MYMDAKIDGQFIKLILDNGSAGSIITRQLIDQLGHQTPIGEIDALPIEVNGIIVLIKLQLNQNGQYTRVPATCGHFKPIITPSAPLIKFKEEKEKPTWEAYQISWANEDHNELLPILSWDDNNKKKQEKELTWNIDQVWKTNNNQDESANWE